MKTPLKYNKFKKYEYIDTPLLEFRKSYDCPDLRGEGHYEYRFKFDNGYGASVIKHYGSYGYENDLFELAVLFFIEEDGEVVSSGITYDTPITDDVVGYLTNDEVLDLLLKIKKLEAWN